MTKILKRMIWEIKKNAKIIITIAILWLLLLLLKALLIIVPKMVPFPFIITVEETLIREKILPIKSHPEQR